MTHYFLHRGSLAEQRLLRFGIEVPEPAEEAQLPDNNEPTSGPTDPLARARNRQELERREAADESRDRQLRTVEERIDQQEASTRSREAIHPRFQTIGEYKDHLYNFGVISDQVVNEIKHLVRQNLQLQTRSGRPWPIILTVSTEGDETRIDVTDQRQNGPLLGTLVVSQSRADVVERWQYVATINRLASQR